MSPSVVVEMSEVKKKGKKAIILHPLYAKRVNEAHERAKREAPRIPMEVMQLVVNKLDDVRTVCRFALVCKTCKHFTNDDALWKKLYLYKFPAPSTPPRGKWRELYKFQTTFFKDVLLNKNLDEILERAYPRWESVGAISLPVRS